jgi:hypothetical protein
MFRRYWFTFDPRRGPSRLRLGCGVTAANYDDALVLLKQLALEDANAIAGCIEDVDVSTLDERHILPNIGDVTRRGIWFPMGLWRP